MANGIRKINKDFFWSIVKPECTLCGYDKCISVLQFHHIKIGQKHDRLDSLGYWLSTSRYNLLKKVSTSDFTILCSNCHIELHLKLRDGEVVNLDPIDTSVFKELFKAMPLNKRTINATNKLLHDTKICLECKQEKNKKKFIRDKDSIDGRSTVCIECYFKSKEVVKPFDSLAKYRNNNYYARKQKRIERKREKAEKKEAEQRKDNP